MKRIIVVQADYGHVELGEAQRVEGGVYHGLDKDELLEQIVKTGKIEYERGGIHGVGYPAVAVVTKTNGDITTVRGNDLGDLIGRDDVEEVAFLSPMAGG